ncbi:MAG: hypothetical protein AAF830_07435 [Pseudomonadota bacterium]
MKKSEKIEIRLSPEEKDRLSRRAETEGRPVSEIVRSVLSSDGIESSPSAPEAENASAALQRWGGYALSFIAGGALAAALTAGQIPDTDIAVWQTEVTLDLPLPKGVSGTPIRYRGTMAMPNEDGASGEMYLSSGPEAGFQIKASHEIQDDGLSIMRFNICRQAGEVCMPWASPYVQSYPAKVFFIEGAGPEGARYSVRVRGIVDPEPEQ